jgi:acetate---CoA ligase (ADP-forming)
MAKSLESVFNPRSIAVIGASEVPGKAAERRTRSLLEGGYSGEVYLINPKRSEIFGRKAYPSLEDVGKEVDLVMIVVAPRFVTTAVKDSIKAGAGGIIIITAGLGETGADGKRIEGEILDMAAQSGTHIIGPNCSGMFSSSARMNLLGIPGLVGGSLSVLAQSGNVIDSISHYAGIYRAGFSKIISVGNAIGVRIHDYLDYLKNDPDTAVIATYLEGIKNGDELVRAAQRTIPEKPIVALKVGRSGAGARAAASHTGSLAGDDAVVDAAFRQAGIVRVSNVDELFDIAGAFRSCPVPRGNRVAILSEGGGDNSIAADNAERFGLEVPLLSLETQQRIKPFLLEGMPASNPIDYGGTAEENPHMITECVRVCMESDEVDCVYMTGFFGGFKDIIASHVGVLEENTSRELVALVLEYQKPLVVHTSFAREDIQSLALLKEAGIPVLEASERAAECLGALAVYASNRRKIGAAHVPIPEPRPMANVTAMCEAVRKEGRKNLLETESRDLLSLYGVPLPAAVLARTAEEAFQAAVQFNRPTALKIVCSDIIHKSDAGGIKLNVSPGEEASAAFDTIIENACRTSEASRIRGALVSPMVPEGQECIAGMVRDPQFGPVVMFGLGGIFVEILKDVSFRVAPLGSREVDEMIREIKGFPLLAGARGRNPRDLDAVKDILLALSRIAIDNPEISEIDLNPVIVHDKGASIVDSRILLM